MLLVVSLLLAIKVAVTSRSSSTNLPVASVRPPSLVKAAGSFKIQETTSVSIKLPSVRTAVTVLSKSAAVVPTGTVTTFGNHLSKAITLTSASALVSKPSTRPDTFFSPALVSKSAGTSHVTVFSSTLPSL